MVDIGEQKKRDRDIIAKGLLDRMENRGWWLSVDSTVPTGAIMYVVYDGAAYMGGGLTRERAAGIVAKCAMPIVFWK